MLATHLNHRLYLAIIFIFALVGCSGGGGGAATSTTTPTTSPTITTATWIANRINSGYSTSYTISGTYGTSTLSGSGTIVVGTPVSAIVSGTALLKITGVISQSRTVTPTSGTPVTNASSSTSYQYMTSSYLPAYYEGDTSFEVIDAGYTVPATIKAGDVGTLGTSVEYSNSTLSTVTGRHSYSYSVATDSATSLLYTTYSDYYDTSNVRVYRYTHTNRVNTDGTSARITSNYINFPTTGSQLIQTLTFN